jgi:hypothetical protein
MFWRNACLKWHDIARRSPFKIGLRWLFSQMAKFRPIWSPCFKTRRYLIPTRLSSFSDAKFSRKTIFTENYFHGKLFSRKTIFTESYFHGKLLSRKTIITENYFHGKQFSQKTIFTENYFHVKTIFMENYFHGKLFSRKNYFHGKLFSWKTIFMENYFHGKLFPQTVGQTRTHYLSIMHVYIQLDKENIYILGYQESLFSSK